MMTCMDQIFRPVGPGGNFHHNAVVEDFDEHLLAIGFARLGDLGVEEWNRSGPDDLLFIPIVYSYRHALELVLKAALTETAACVRTEADPDPDLDHEALRRWLAGPSSQGQPGTTTSPETEEYAHVERRRCLRRPLLPRRGHPRGAVTRI
jgi:hypothetical protein